MKKQFSLILASFLASGMLLLTGCKESPSESKTEANNANATTTVGIQASMGQTGGNQSVTGSMFNIDSMEVTVKDASTDAIYQDRVTMNYSNGKWNALIDGLPVGKNVSFSVNAYENDADSSPDILEKTFTGVTYKVLQDSDTVTVALASTKSTDIITLPQLYSVETTEEIGIDTSTDLKLLIRGRDNSTINYKITTTETGGSFSTTNGSVQLNGNSATLVVGYVAPLASLGTQRHNIQLTDTQGNVIRTSFKTNVVLASQGSSAMFAQFAPRIKYINMNPRWLDDYTNKWVDVKIYIEDDQSNIDMVGDLVYEKDATSDNAYFSKTWCQPSYCWYNLRNYTPTSTGWLRFTATDPDGLSTSFSTYIPARLFSDPND